MVDVLLAIHNGTRHVKLAWGYILNVPTHYTYEFICKSTIYKHGSEKEILRL